RKLGFGREAMKATPFARNEIGHVDGFLNVAARLSEHLAHFSSHIAGELLLALNQDLADLEQDFGATGSRGLAPGRQCGGGSLDARVDIISGGSREAAYQFPGVGWIAVFNVPAGRRSDPFTADVVAIFFGSYF